MVAYNRLLGLDLHRLILSEVNSNKRLILSKVKINNPEVSSSVADYKCSCVKNFESLKKIDTIIVEPSFTKNAY